MQCSSLSIVGLVKLLEEGPDFSMDRNQYLSTGGLNSATIVYTCSILLHSRVG